MQTRPTPGVYEDLAKPVVDKPVRDDIAAFVGLTRRGPVDRAIWVESWEAFVATFGPRSDSIATPDSALGFFVNGGRAAYVVRVLDRGTAKSARALCRALQLADPSSAVASQSPAVDAKPQAPPVARDKVKVPLRLPILLGKRWEPMLPLALPLRLPRRTTVTTPAPPEPTPTPVPIPLFWYAAQAGLEDPGVWANGMRCSLHFTLRALAPAPTQKKESDDQLRIPPDIRDRDAWGRIDPGCLLWCPDADLAQRGRFAIVTAVNRVVEKPDPSQVLEAPATVLQLDRRLRLSGTSPVFIVEATLIVQSRAGSERHDALGLCPQHARYLPNVLRSESRLVALSIPSPAPILYPQEHALTALPGAPLPPDSLALAVLGRESPSDDETQPSMYAGCDGLAQVDRLAFFGVDDPWDEITPPRGLSCLSALSDVSLVMMPDLALPAQQPKPTVALLPPAPESCKRPIWVCGGVDDTSQAQPPVDAPVPPGLIDPLYLQDPQQMAELIRAQLRLVAMCERLGDRIALLSPPPSASPKQTVLWRSHFSSPFAAAYYPWLLFGDAVTHPPVRLLPPLGVSAGIIARSELQFGVGRAPANLSVYYCTGLAHAVDDAEWAYLHEVSCNLFRQQPNEIRLLGARTLSSDPEYRYLHVRRLITHIKRLLYARMQWVVFENNNPSLWARLRRDIEARVLRPLFLRGAFATDAPETSYFIRCDEVTNPRQRTDEGRLVCEIGVAPTIPSEYIVFRLSATRSEGLSVGEVG